MRANITLSVVTVSLDAEHTIGDTIASVALQSTDLVVEHLCVDGGSRDGTRDIIDACALRFPHIVRIYEPDRGIFDAMNKGLAAARGEYVLFLNADDFLMDRQVLARALGCLPPALGCVSPTLARIPSAGGRTAPGGMHGAERWPDMILGDVVMGAAGERGLWRHRRVPRSLARWSGSGLFPIHQGVFARRDLLVRAGGLDTAQRLGADVTLFYDLQRNFSPTLCLLGSDVAFMTAGGAANQSVAAMVLGSREIYRHARRFHGRLRSAGMVAMKTLQSLSEVRYGRCPGRRWFVADEAG